VVAFQIAAGHIIKEEVRAALGMKLFRELLFD
jgi:hypothetical protein